MAPSANAAAGPAPGRLARDECLLREEAIRRALYSDRKLIVRAEVTLEGGRAPGRGWRTASAPVAFSHFRGGAEVALFCFKMAAGMYLEHYLDSKSRLEERVRGHRGVGVGVRAEELYGPEVPMVRKSIVKGCVRENTGVCEEIGGGAAGSRPRLCCRRGRGCAAELGDGS